jgi:hypothetical protein
MKSGTELILIYIGYQQEYKWSCVSGVVCTVPLVYGTAYPPAIEDLLYGLTRCSPGW